MKRYLLPFLMAFWITSANAEPPCNGKFFNPFTDICWSCIFPLTLGSSQILKMGQEDNNSDVGSSPVCACTNSLKVGIKTGFWEPARVFEAVRSPYCFTSLGGVRIDPGIPAPNGMQSKRGEAKTKESFYHAHWYMSPLMFWLEILLDDSCVEQGVFDLAYFTEVDPLWSDSELNFIINPDAALFSNPIARAACAVDCVAATAGFSNNLLYWCGGCQGGMYPLMGHISAHVGGVQASSLLLQRMTMKLHREGLMWSASGEDGLCGYYPQPIMDKTSYKAQMIAPVPNTQKIDGKCCQPYGRTTALWGAGKEFPVTGEDFAYMIYRKRDCCGGFSLLP